MNIMFCPKCHSLLFPSEGMLRCNCGYKEKAKIKLSERLKKEREIKIIEEEHTGNSELPIVCWNCGSKGVYFWMVQMRCADEPPTRFYKCKKCKKIWRSGK